MGGAASAQSPAAAAHLVVRVQPVAQAAHLWVQVRVLLAARAGHAHALVEQPVRREVFGRVPAARECGRVEGPEERGHTAEHRGH